MSFSENLKIFTTLLESHKQRSLTKASNDQLEKVSKDLVKQLSRGNIVDFDQPAIFECCLFYCRDGLQPFPLKQIVGVLTSLFINIAKDAKFVKNTLLPGLEHAPSSIIRGLASSLSEELLYGKDWSCNGEIPFQADLMQACLGYVERSNLLSDRINGFDAIHMLLQRLHKSNRDISSNLFETLMLLFQSNLRETEEVVQQKVRLLFEAMLLLLPAQSKGQYLQVMCEKVFQMPKQVKTKFIMINALVKRFPEVFDDYASLIGICLNEAKDMLRFSTHASKCGQLIVTFLTHNVEKDKSSSTLLISDWVLSLLTSPDQIIRQNCKTYILQDLCRRYPSILLDLLRQSDDIYLHISILSFFPNNEETTKYGNYFLQCANIRGEERTVNTMVLSRAARSIDLNQRLAVLQFICSQRKIQPEQMEILLMLIRLSMPHTCPNYREKLISYLSSFLTNLYVAQRKKSKFGYESLVGRLKELCIDSLFPGASFGRVQTALTLWHLLVHQDHGPETTPILTCSLLELNLLLSVMNCSFPSHRKLCSEILLKLAPKMEKSTIEAYKSCGLKWLESIRGSVSQMGCDWLYLLNRLEVSSVTSTTMGYTEYEKSFVKDLLETINYKVNQAKSQLLATARTSAIHGIWQLLSIYFQHAPVEWTDLMPQVITTLQDTMDLVLPVVENSSPEGQGDNLADEEDEDFEDGGEGDDPRVVLSFCWRAVKSVSMLMMGLAQNKSIIITNEQLVRLIGLFINALLSARHRGAFSALFPALEASLFRLKEQDGDYFQPYLMGLIKDTFKELESGYSVSSTRRSAGLPMCFVAYVKAYPELAFDVIMNLLLGGIERLEEIESIQHCFNCLRAIVNNSSLTALLVYKEETIMKLCINTFNSNSWKLRNCALMLFTAIITKIFIAGKGISIKEFFSRYPSMREFLEDQLEKAVGAEIYPFSLYPLLLLISKLTFLDKKAALTDPLLEGVGKCLGSNHFKVRELVALILSPFGSSSVEMASKFISNPPTSNQIHGLLCLMERLANSFKDSNDLVEQDLMLRVTLIAEGLINHPCPIISKMANRLAKGRRPDQAELLVVTKEKEVEEEVEVEKGEYYELRNLDLQVLLEQCQYHQSLELRQSVVKQLLGSTTGMEDIPSTLNQISPKNAVDLFFLLTQLLQDEDEETIAGPIAKLITKENVLPSFALEELSSYYLQRTTLRDGIIDGIIKNQLDDLARLLDMETKQNRQLFLKEPANASFEKPWLLSTTITSPQLDSAVVTVHPAQMEKLRNNLHRLEELDLVVTYSQEVRIAGWMSQKLFPKTGLAQ